jgi:hypothetical protein
MQFVVRIPFGAFKRGDVVENPDVFGSDELLNRHCVRVAAPAAPTPPPTPAKGAN